MSVLLASLSSSFGANSNELKISHMVNEANFVSLEVTDKYILLPVQDNAPEAKVGIIKDNVQPGVYSNVRLARERVDYYVPYDISEYRGGYITVDIQGMPQNSICWSNIKFSDTFDSTNTEKFRPSYHHTPAYGWMNDPNGMFYKDGVYHLYFQYNPYGSMWGNMHWGHSTSTDLVNWKNEGVAIAPDAIGTIFSGSCVVDHNNTSGFGEGAVVAFYTSAKPTPWGDCQTQSMAYSLDNGKTPRPESVLVCTKRTLGNDACRRSAHGNLFFKEPERLDEGKRIRRRTWMPWRSMGMSGSGGTPGRRY